MIKKRDTLRLLVPYPNAQSVLANTRHMYVCMKENHGNYEFVKCQTLKPSMLIKSPMVNYIDEKPDKMRNPFEHDTRIDCDKVFTSSGVLYKDALKTTARPNVCEDVFQAIVQKLQSPTIIPMNETDLIRLNSPNVIKK